MWRPNILERTDARYPLKFGGFVRAFKRLGANISETGERYPLKFGIFPLLISNIKRFKRLFSTFKSSHES